MRLLKGEIEEYQIGKGVIKLTPFWDDSEVVEYHVKIGKRVDGAGGCVVVASREINSWLRLKFPATTREAGFDQAGNWRATGVKFGEQ